MTRYVNKGLDHQLNSNIEVNRVVIWHFDETDDYEGILVTKMIENLEQNSFIEKVEYNQSTLEVLILVEDYRYLEEVAGNMDALGIGEVQIREEHFQDVEVINGMRQFLIFTSILTILVFFIILKTITNRFIDHKKREIGQLHVLGCSKNAIRKVVKNESVLLMTIAAVVSFGVYFGLENMIARGLSQFLNLDFKMETHWIDLCIVSLMLILANYLLISILVLYKIKRARIVDLLE
ncbi:ABC transporter permease [Fusibacter sp. Q10-2]|uniref:ABC transporter permease n=2 Tax=Fusibacter ferrireducens TaxID=2785058 RepID=A0ABR9ZSB7_9FIRM|nr:ABC transporter permease [Fusibacter ferrireducens]